MRPKKKKRFIDPLRREGEEREERRVERKWVGGVHYFAADKTVPELAFLTFFKYKYREIVFLCLRGVGVNYGDCFPFFLMTRRQKQNRGAEKKRKFKKGVLYK